jgi:nucleoside-diphosphate-sugar epimerase
MERQPIRTIDELEERLSRPNAADVACARRLGGDVAIIGAGGKMGPSLARKVKRAFDEAGVHRRVAAISTGWEPAAAAALSSAGVETIECDCLDRRALDALSSFPNVLYLVGRKFGTEGRTDLTWAINSLAPAMVAERFSASRLVVFSSGNLYGMVPAAGGGSRETDRPNPVGEYAQSCLARERIVEYFSRERGLRCVLFRLNYSVDLRYGVLMDVGHRVHDGETIDLRVPCANVIWQGDANSYAFRCLELADSPPRVLNVTGPERVSIRELAGWFGRRFGRAPRLVEPEGDSALLSDASACHAALGVPEVPLATLREWAARWIEAGGERLSKPTKYEVADGRY